MTYMIAYSEKDGKDFDHGIPFIGDSYTIKEAARACVWLYKKQGYQNVTSFSVQNITNLPEIIDWNYVKKHRVNLDTQT